MNTSQPPCWITDTDYPYQDTDKSLELIQRERPFRLWCQALQPPPKNTIWMPPCSELAFDIKKNQFRAAPALSHRSVPFLCWNEDQVNVRILQRHLSVTGEEEEGAVLLVGGILLLRSFLLNLSTYICT